MNKQVLWLFFVLLIGYLALVFCDENVDNALQSEKINEVQNESKELFDEARTRRRHKLFHYFWGWHALAIAYWIKVKVIIVSFFVGSAVFVGLRYFYPHKCSSDISHDGPIIYDNPYSFSHHHDHDHDHIPYSVDHSHQFEHSFDSGSFEPYSAYAGTYSDTVPTSVAASGPGDAHSIKRRSLNSVERQKQAVSMEDQMADIMFSFLGLDSKACRQRFICEMEFRSRLNPLSSMAFRIVGRGFFDKYTNVRNTRGRATSFQECAMVNPDCVFIEGNDTEQEAQESEISTTEVLNTLTVNDDDAKESNSTSEENKTETETENMEAQNDINISDENRHAKKRYRMHRNLNDVAERLFAQKL